MVYGRIILLLILFTLQNNGVNAFTIYDTRLGSSSTSRAASGRVEVLIQRGWAPVCSYNWGSDESRVLCRQLGYTYSSSSTSSLSVNSLRYNFYCSGAESSISQCYHTFYREEISCRSIITVNCSPCTNGGVRLHGGIVPEAGTVEYCTGGTWKAVCDNSWDYKDSFVVCRQLGFPATGVIRYLNSYFGIHAFPSTIYFNCFGNETSLSSCRSSTSSTSLCGADDAAGVHCKGDIITDVCNTGHIRLAGGRDASEGRVEICSNGVWGTVFYGSWDSLDATVACRQLGLYQTYSRVEVFRSNSYFGAGTGPVLFAYLNCSGTESALSDCSTTSSYYYGIGHSDAGVRCNRNAIITQSDCSNGDVRLVNGTAPYEGRVEICYGGVWGSVCDNGWDKSDAVIVCRQMGFQRINATALRGSVFGDGDGPYHLSDVDCSGEERTLLQCSYGRSTVGYHICTPGRDAGVKCDVSMACNDGDVRLFGGYTKNDGIAEVCIGGQWADICYSGVTNQTALAMVFCRQLIGREPRVYTSSCCSRQQNAGNVTLYNINCNDRSRGFVQDCTYSVIMEYNTAPASGCTLQNKLIIECYEQSTCTAEGDLRLRGGNSTHQGRVELCSQGVWGTFTEDFFYSFWSQREAMVVCKQLGYPWEWASIASFEDIFGRGNLPTFSTDLHCSGTEQRLSECFYSRVRISRRLNSYPIANVICQGNTSAPTECQHGDVRLVDGRNKAEGRLETCAYGYWAIPCDRSWNILGTELVCKQLGLSTNGSMYKSGGPFESNYQLPIIRISCGIGVTNISECQFTTQSYNCYHRNSIGIYCQEREEQYYSIKVDTSPMKGSYEIGSSVTLNCTITPEPAYEPSSIVYRWYSSAPHSSSSPQSTLTTTLRAYHPTFVDYYCQTFHNGRLLGRGRITLNVKDVLQRNVTDNSDGSIHAQKKETITLQVETTPNNVLKGLLGLTWYHDDVIIEPNCGARFTLNNNNKTLTISNFTSSDAGIYKAQFDQLFVHPFDDSCRDEVLSLMQHLPILRPAVFCVNMDGNCSDVDLKLQKREISVQAINQDLQGTLNVNLEATGQLLTSKELTHSYIQWFQNGARVTNSLSTLKRQCSNLTLSQGLQQINATYEHSGRYEVLLRLRMSNYLQDGSTNCRPYYDRFVSSYISSEVTLARGFVDVGYHKDLKFDLYTDKNATTRDKGATLTCRASIVFPPFSMLSLIKNREVVATSSSGMLQVNTKSVSANPFGLYTCQLNASGEIFQKFIELKERVRLKMKMSGENCIKSAIEDELVLKISSECRCSFNKSYLLNSSIECSSNNQLTYSAILEYSTDTGSETASIIVERIVGQTPFFMVVGGTRLTVTNACTTDCEDAAKASRSSAEVSPAIGSGLFAGGFAAAILITLTLMIIVILVVRRCAKSQDKDGRRVEVKTDPLRYASAGGTAHQDVSLKGSGAAAEYMTPQPKKSSVYQAMGPRDQPSQYETMQLGDQPIYEETF